MEVNWSGPVNLMGGGRRSLVNNGDYVTPHQLAFVINYGGGWGGA